MKINLLKTKIFNLVSKSGKTYWAIAEHAYKNDQDKITYFVNFIPNIPEPTPKTAISKGGKEYKYIDIKKAECDLGCYNQAPKITIFSYSLKEDEEKEDNSMMGGEKSDINKSIDIESDELPFYGG